MQMQCDNMHTNRAQRKPSLLNPRREGGGYSSDSGIHNLLEAKSYPVRGEAKVESKSPSPFAVEPVANRWGRNRSAVLSLRILKRLLDRKTLVDVLKLGSEIMYRAEV